MAAKFDADKYGSVEMFINNIIGGIGLFEIRKDKITPLFLNDGFYRMIGSSKTEIDNLLMDIRENIVDEDRLKFEQSLAEVLKDDGWVEVEFRTKRKNGIIRWYQVRSNLFSRTSESHIITTLILDATERKNMDQELKLQAERLNLLSDVEGEHIFDYNAKADTLLIKASKDDAAEHDIIVADFMQKQQYDNIFEEDKAFFVEFLEACMKSPKRDNLNVRINLFESGYRWYRIVGSSILGNEGYVTRMVGRITDIHEDKLKEIELEIKAEKDTLTQTYNKGATEHIIRGILEEERANNSSKLHALLVIDLDNFKAINDNLGHAYGDLVLSEAAGKMKDMFKGHDVVGRVGGDEFVIFMYDVEDVRNVFIIARKLCKLIATKYPCVSGDIAVTSSIGIAVCTNPFPDYIDLFNQADAAMYVSKNSGKNGCTLYGDDM